MSNNTEDKAPETSTLPSEQTGWNLSFPSIHLVTTDEALKDTQEKIAQAQKLMDEEQYEDAANLLSEASETTYASILILNGNMKGQLTVAKIL